MAEQEKDNFLMIVGVIAAIAITGVVLLKSRETEHLKSQSASTNIQQDAEVLAKARDLNNVLE